MDEELNALLGPSDVRPGETKTLAAKLRIKEDGSGQIEVETADCVKPYTLKPLAELYGTGTGAESIDPKDEQFTPLLSAIEEEIARYYEELDPGLTDGQVLITVKQLGMNPEAEPADPLGRRLSVALRLTLSLNDYSRQDVKGCLRQVAKSVERHTKAEGRRGYLELIRRFFGRRR